MTEPNRDLLLQILHACADIAPTPFYPSSYTPGHGIDRPSLDAALDHLRLRGLLRLTDWVQGRGQGYTITAEGQAALHEPRLVDRAPTPAPRMVVAEPDEMRDPWSRGEAVRDALINPVKPRVTLTLLAVNIVVFLAGFALALQQNVSAEEYFAGKGPNLSNLHYSMGALERTAVLGNGEWWRVLTCAFLHRGFLHVLLNMYMLYSFGPLVETLWGSWRFLYLYLTSALWCSCMVLAMDTTDARLVGASGALCGLLGSFGVWTVLNRAHLPPNLVSSWLRNLLINVVLLVLISSLPGVSWLGHFGGALGGVLAAVPLNNQRFGNSMQQFVGWIGMITVPVAGVALVLVQSSDTRSLAALRAEFQRAERAAALTFNDHAQETLKQWSDIEPARLEAAKRSFTDAVQVLLAAQKQLDAFDPKDDPRVAQDVRLASTYLGVWLRFYEALLETVNQPPPWPDARHAAVMEIFRSMEPTRGPLANSPVMPSLWGPSSKE